jgi:large subunit ribosomal protein L35
MPKMKTRSLAKRRFSRTGTGKVKHAKAFRRHLLSKKNRKTKNKLRKTNYLFKGDAAKFVRIMPYSL